MIIEQCVTGVPRTNNATAFRSNESWYTTVAEHDQLLAQLNALAGVRQVRTFYDDYVLVWLFGETEEAVGRNREAVWSTLQQFAASRILTPA